MVAGKRTFTCEGSIFLPRIVTALRARDGESIIPMTPIDLRFGEKPSSAGLGHCPHHTGLRFSMNAPIPSCASRLERLVTITSAAYVYASARGSSAWR